VEHYSHGHHASCIWLPRSPTGRRHVADQTWSSARGRSQELLTGRIDIPIGSDQRLLYWAKKATGGWKFNPALLDTHARFLLQRRTSD
jgi:hypothetical protein